MTAMAATNPISGEDRGIGEVAAVSEWEKSIDDAVLAGEKWTRRLRKYGCWTLKVNFLKISSQVILTVLKLL